MLEIFSEVKDVMWHTTITEKVWLMAWHQSLRNDVLFSNDAACSDVIISKNVQKLPYFLDIVYYILILGIVNKFTLDFKEKSCNWKFGKFSTYAAEKYESN